MKKKFPRASIDLGGGVCRHNFFFRREEGELRRVLLDVKRYNGERKREIDTRETWKSKHETWKTEHEARNTKIEKKKLQHEKRQSKQSKNEK